MGNSSSVVPLSCGIPQDCNLLYCIVEPKSKLIHPRWFHQFQDFTDHFWLTYTVLAPSDIAALLWGCRVQPVILQRDCLCWFMDFSLPWFNGNICTHLLYILSYSRNIVSFFPKLSHTFAVRALIVPCFFKGLKTTERETSPRINSGVLLIM